MNSSIEIAEAVKLADKLIARTREGKLTWEADGILRSIIGPTDVSVATAFTASLEGDLKATVSTTKQGQDEQLVFNLVEGSFPSLAASLVGPVPLRKDVLSVSVEKNPSYGYDTVEEKQLAGFLVDLYGLARRSALQLDQSVEKALSYLDRIAV
jgi:hypothetical protein